MWSYKVNATLIVAVSYSRVADCREVEISLVSSSKDEQISYLGNDGPFQIQQFPLTLFSLVSPRNFRIFILGN